MHSLGSRIYLLGRVVTAVPGNVRKNKLDVCFLSDDGMYSKNLKFKNSRDTSFGLHARKLWFAISAKYLCIIYMMMSYSNRFSKYVDKYRKSETYASGKNVVLSRPWSGHWFNIDQSSGTLYILYLYSYSFPQ